MYKSKLYLILQHFDKYEQNRCRKYLQSPYFNRSQELMQLYEALIAEVNGDVRGTLDKEQLWADLQPGKAYDDVRFRKYCSDLLKLVEGYLAQEVYEQDAMQRAINTMEAIGKRKIAPLAASSVRSANRLAQNAPYRSSDYYYSLYKVEKALYQLQESDIKRAKRSNVEQISDNLDFFYVSEKLRYYCLVLMQQTFVAEEYQIMLIEQITAKVQAYGLDKIPPIAVYYQIYLLLQNNNDEAQFYNLISILKKYNLAFPTDEAYNMYTYAMNFCIGRANQGQVEYVEAYFDIYKELLQTQILFREGKLSPWDFKNIVVAALRLGEYQWTENFIKDYARNLPDSFRENAVTYNLAQVYFYQKKHDKVIEQLRNVEYEDSSYNLNSKTMLLATYYETDEIEPLYSLIESFRAYLNRHKKDIPESKRRRYQNLIKFTRKLTQVMPGDKENVAKIRKEIEETPGIVSHNWLLEKLAELES